MSIDKKKKREIIGTIIAYLFVIPLLIIHYLYLIFDFLADELQDFEEWSTASLCNLVTKLVGDDDKDGS